MRALFLLALVSLTAAAQDYDGRFGRFCSRSAQGRSIRGFQCDDLAFFEFAPASGAGMPAACSTTAPTGAKGEALTFTRASTAVCTKTATGGLATTGIANGDLVLYPSNMSRVEYDPNGTLGLLVESSRTNKWLRSEEFDNAGWSKTDDGTGAGAPTVTANFAVAPDGTTTAERIQFNSCTTSGFISKVQQVASVTASVALTASVYVKGNGTSGSLSLCSFTTVGSCTTCSYVASTWTRCTHALASTSATTYLNLGCTNSGSYSGGAGGQAAQDVLVWGFDGEEGAFASSYIPTVAATVTRAAETARFAVATPAPNASVAATRTGPLPAAGAQIIVLGQNNGLAQYGLGVFHSAGVRTAIITPATTLAVGGATTSPTRAWASWNGTTLTANFDGTSATSTPATTLLSRDSVAIGLDLTGASYTDGIISRVCIDPDPSRCR